MFCLFYPALMVELLQKGLKYFKVLMVRIYMLLHHLVLGSRTYLLLHKCTTLNYVVEKSTFTELLSLLPKRTVGVDIAKKIQATAKY